MSIRTLAGLLVVFAALAGSSTLPAQTARRTPAAAAAPEGPCDIYAAAGTPCAAAHSTTRALYRSYTGPLYQVLRQSDGRTLNISVVKRAGDEGGYADSAAQDLFCANTYCVISRIYDQSPNHNDLAEAPRGGFSGPAIGGANSLPLADMAPATLRGHKVYGVFIAPGSGLRIDDPRGTAVDDQAEGQYWVINGHHFNSGCCFDYGNAEIDSRDDDNGTMETAYFGDSIGWIHGNLPGPWIMTDQENNLVGCVGTATDGLCPHLPDITWRFVTAMAKGEPHHWTSLGGDAQRGELSVMFDGGRVNSSYDPMRKQGAILLGNGGDNSNSSQGTFYEGAVTAAGTFPTDSTDQLVQQNIVAARYGAERLSLAPAGAPHSPGLVTFRPGTARDLTVSFTNSGDQPVSGLVLRLPAPDRQWTTAVSGGGREASKSFSEPVAPGSTVSATFTVTPGPKPFNGDLLASASWRDAPGHPARTEQLAHKVRSAAPVTINELRIGSGARGNPTDSFVELYNSGAEPVDLSGWSLTARPAQQPAVAAVSIPRGTRLAPRAFYLLGLSNSGLAVPAAAGAGTLHVRNVAGITVGDTLSIGNGTGAEERRVATLGTAAAAPTTVWHPLPDGPITLPPGTTAVPVESITGFKAGDRVALGYGAASPHAGSSMERFEVATVSAVGKPGTQAYLAADAQPGGTNLKVTAVDNISVGDKIRLDISSKGHGIETVTVTRVGTKATQTNLTADVEAGATTVGVRRSEGFAVGDKITVGTPASREEVTVSAVEHGSGNGRGGAELTVTPALAQKHGRDEWVVAPGTGLELAAPLRFAHAANLPFSDRGTGVTFSPATRFPHRSGEPVVALGSGITLDRPLSKPHAIFAVVRDSNSHSAGYQGKAEPNQWFGGPELSTESPSFGRVVTVHEGSLVLRDGAGLTVDSLNYGGLADLSAAEGYQAASGQHAGGCFVPSPEPAYGFGVPAVITAVNRSAGRFPDGTDTDSNCTDFLVQPATTLPTGAVAGSHSLHVTSVTGFRPGQKLLVGDGAEEETVAVREVGTGGATATTKETTAGETQLPVGSVAGFEPGEAVTVGAGSDAEKATVASRRGFNEATITLSKPLAHAHRSGTPVAGTGLTLASGLSHAHTPGAPVAGNLPTPGAPNQSGPGDTAGGQP